MASSEEAAREALLKRIADWAPKAQSVPALESLARSYRHTIGGEQPSAPADNTK